MNKQYLWIYVVLITSLGATGWAGVDLETQLAQLEKQLESQMQTSEPNLVKAPEAKPLAEDKILAERLQALEAGQQQLVAVVGKTDTQFSQLQNMLSALETKLNSQSDPQLVAKLTALDKRLQALEKKPVPVKSDITADAGPNQSITHNTLVNLDGSDSFDDNTETGNLLFAWSFTALPTGSLATITNADKKMASFLADKPGTYKVKLVVTDEASQASEPDEVVISSSNVAPTAVAGDDQVAVVNKVVYFDGLDSSDPESDPITYAWTITSAPTGSTAIIVGDSTATPSFTPDLTGEYTIKLVVYDGYDYSIPDTLTLTVVTGTELAGTKLKEASDLIVNLSDGAFDAKGHRTSLANMLTKIVSFLLKKLKIQNWIIQTSMKVN